MPRVAPYHSHLHYQEWVSLNLNLCPYHLWMITCNDFNLYFFVLLITHSWVTVDHPTKQLKSTSTYCLSLWKHTEENKCRAAGASDPAWLPRCSHRPHSQGATRQDLLRGSWHHFIACHLCIVCSGGLMTWQLV